MKERAKFKSKSIDQQIMNQCFEKMAGKIEVRYPIDHVLDIAKDISYSLDTNRNKLTQERLHLNLRNAQSIYIKELNRHIITVNFKAIGSQSAQQQQTYSFEPELGHLKSLQTFMRVPKREGYSLAYFSDKNKQVFQIIATGGIDFCSQLMINQLESLWIAKDSISSTKGSEELLQI